jgi:ATP-dependent Clp protease adapter protein ClpS
MKEIVTEESTKERVNSKVLKMLSGKLTIHPENIMTKEQLNDAYRFEKDKAINALMKVCGTTPEEAKWLIQDMFFTGTCVVRAGVHENLMPLKYQLDALGFNAKIYFNHVKLVIYIDYINGLEYISDALEKVCGFSHETATSCAYKIRDNEFCYVKKGSFETLKPLRDQLRSLRLFAVLE